MDFRLVECSVLTPVLFFQFFAPRLDIEICEGCNCDGLQIVQSSSFSFLPYFSRKCERLSDNYLEYRSRLGSPKKGVIYSTRIYIRFVSDDSVHRKGFNISFVAESYEGKFIEN